MKFIGDTHTKFDRYAEIIDGCDESIQVGDFGIGIHQADGSVRQPPEMNSRHRFIRGNHDDPDGCRHHPNWIPDATKIGDMFFVGGGFSIDRMARTEGLDWWVDEELSMSDLYSAVDAYEAAKPTVMVSHECPSDVAPLLFGRDGKRQHNPSRTSQALGSMLYIHRPETWIFGHWHRNVDRVIDGTRFICLAELAHIDL